MTKPITDEQLDPREVLNFLIEAVERLQEENEQLKNDKALLLKIDKKYQRARKFEIRAFLDGENK